MSSQSSSSPSSSLRPSASSSLRPSSASSSSDFPFFSSQQQTQQSAQQPDHFHSPRSIPRHTAPSSSSLPPPSSSSSLPPPPSPSSSSSSSSSSLNQLQLSARRWRLYDRAVATILKCFPGFDHAAVTSLHSSPEHETHPAFITQVSSVLIVDSAPDLGLQCRRDLVKGDVRPRRPGELLRGDRVRVPLWVAVDMFENGIVRVEYPEYFNETILTTLHRNPLEVDVCGFHPYYFTLGKILSNCCSSVYGSEPLDGSDSAIPASSPMTIDEALSVIARVRLSPHAQRLGYRVEQILDVAKRKRTMALNQERAVGPRCRSSAVCGVTLDEKELPMINTNCGLGTEMVGGMEEDTEELQALEG
eukprot:GHVS01061065.1.p1 GENE.GHVS01061065.1~~GHVS01061065.1.p1  ORF type:complete len:360 (+),score=122.98 GHVS01061065.1:79-1158(+)